MKKRIMVLMAVAALMVVMLAMSVGPAFAAAPLFACTNPETGFTAYRVAPEVHWVRAEGYTQCSKV
jgi:threonine/homoserine efflux transporter RhtA